MRIVAGQRRTAREFLAALRPHWRSDAGLPGRIDRLLKGDRRLGSRDRRLYRELIYTSLRYLPWIEPLLDPAPDLADAALAWLAADLPATRPYRSVLAADWPPCPSGAAAKAAVLRRAPVRRGPPPLAAARLAPGRGAGRLRPGSTMTPWPGGLPSGCACGRGARRPPGPEWTDLGWPVETERAAGGRLRAARGRQGGRERRLSCGRL